jgi:hypothetical protein
MNKGVPAKQVASYFLFGAILALVSDIPDSFGILYWAAKSLLYALLFTSLILPVRRGLVFLLVIAVVGQDVIQGTSEAAETGSFLMASIWQGQFGPLRPSWIIMGYCLVMLLRSRVQIRDQYVMVAIAWFATVPFITGFLYGGFDTSHSTKHIITDMKLPLLLISSALLYSTHMRRYPESVPTLVAAFIGAVMARHGATFVLWLNGVGSVHVGVNRASVDSTKFTLAILFILAVYTVLIKKRPIRGGVLGTLSGLLIVVYTTRMLWLTTFFGTVMAFLSMRLSKWLVAAPAAALLVFGAFTLLQQLAPDNVNLATSKGDRFSKGLTHENYLEQLDPARYAEIINILDTNADRFALLWGSGYGSYYTQSARMFPAKMKDAFPDYMLDSGQFFNAHNYVFLMLFKHGAVGFIVISSLWLIPGWKCFKLIRKSSPARFSIAYSSMVMFLPTTILTLYWSGKGDIISGFCIAFYIVFHEMNDPKPSSTTP